MSFILLLILVFLIGLKIGGALLVSWFVVFIPLYIIIVIQLFLAFIAVSMFGMAFSFFNRRH